MLLDGFEMNLQIEYLLGLGVLTVCSSTWPLWCLKCLTTKQLHYEWDNNNVIHCTMLSFVAFGNMLFSHVWIFTRTIKSKVWGMSFVSLQCNVVFRFSFHDFWLAYKEIWITSWPWACFPTFTMQCRLSFSLPWLLIGL